MTEVPSRKIPTITHNAMLRSFFQAVNLACSYIVAHRCHMENTYT